MLQTNFFAAKIQTDSNVLKKIFATTVLAGFAATMLQPILNDDYSVHAATFDQRCSAAGVVICSGLNTTTDINSFISGNDLGQYLASLDTVNKSSGTGSLKFVVPSMSGENSSGTFDRVFEESGTGFDSGDTFYVQFRQRFSPEMLNSTMGGSGWYQVVLSSQFGYYGEPMDIGLYNLAYGNKPTLIHNSIVEMQTPEDGTPVSYVANEWMTFAFKITVGEFSSTPSRIEVWAAREGQNLEKIYDINAVVPRNPGDPTSGFNKITFGPYNMGKDATNSHPVATTWYDELIVSTQEIADPVPPVDRTAPTAPSLNATTSGTTINLSWSGATDNVGVTGYKLFRDGLEITDQTGTTFADSNRATGTTYSYSVKAYDAQGNLSTASNAVTASVSDTSAPTVPTLTAAVNETAVSLSWTASTDNIGVTGYKLYRNGNEIATQTSTSYVDSGLTRNTTYNYTVKAFDAAGNNSALSAEVTATIPAEVVVEPTPTPTPPSTGGGSSKPRKPKNPRHPRTTLVEDRGTIYFLGEKYRYAFPSMEVFNSWDAKLEDVVKATDGDLAMPLGPIVEYKVKQEGRHQRGTLINHKGTIYFLGETVRYPFPSIRVFNSWGAKLENVVAASAGDLQMPIGEIIKFKK